MDTPDAPLGAPFLLATCTVEARGYFDGGTMRPNRPPVKIGDVLTFSAYVWQDEDAIAHQGYRVTSVEADPIEYILPFMDMEGISVVGVATKVSPGGYRGPIDTMIRGLVDDYGS
mmetsp:Transcript_15650/g.26171  ORF Transcript_15650/g.26171 Transcript_15650/m.26171 type:complete len:115 (-) Transcript_15650:445-789(-)